MDENSNGTQCASCLMEIFKDYEYLYEDTSNTTKLKHHKPLRYDIDDYNTINLTMSVTTIDRSKIDRYVNTTTRYVADFYNIEPAAGKIKIKEDIITGVLTNNTVWYVPEQYPCWDLPVLYAQLGKRRRSSEVFLVYSGSLRNVIDEGDSDLPLPKSFNVPAEQTLNKWCAVSPCYGDHTLCVFADKTISHICDKGYQVLVPNMVEQIALVNTVNSMRNRVANGVADRYKHLPTAANMEQIIYDFDLEKMSKAWLRQCLPGPAPCSALDGNYVTQLECTKYAELCCVASYRKKSASKCIPKAECFVSPIIGCIHAWFWSAGSRLTKTDVECGHPAPSTFHTIQLLWAHTTKIGCAYGKRPNGDVRVVCSFAPGAPFYIDTKLYCGLIAHRDVTHRLSIQGDITSVSFLSDIGIQLKPLTDETEVLAPRAVPTNVRISDAENINKIYKQGWLRKKIPHNTNETTGLIARLVTKYTFYEGSEARCDTEEPVYISGEPGSLCVERGRRFSALCYDFRDPTPGYRLVAVLAPAALFSLILFDLFSGVMRHNIN
ncbi:uncharacterized protein LOC115441305 [Manduca sexta]|uniref:uncharacterized protein LOC115441305 n=1 Tax=Manduca sexta TaxID=7130 RepID=UPI00188F6C07|nr:uncharacterized protein LOC115441305 [Manduca sexta]